MRYLLILIYISLLTSCGRDKSNLTTGTRDNNVDRDFREFLNAIPKQSLPLELSCGLPNETNSADEFEAFRKFIPKSTDRIFGTIKSSTDFYKLIICGQTGDDIYPIMFSFDNKGEIKDSLFLMLRGCGGADESQIPHSFASIGKDLKITLTDTTRLIHFPDNSKSVDDYIVDSLRVSRVVFKVDQNGKFVNQ